MKLTSNQLKLLGAMMPAVAAMATVNMAHWKNALEIKLDEDFGNEYTEIEVVPVSRIARPLVQDRTYDRPKSSVKVYVLEDRDTTSDDYLMDQIAKHGYLTGFKF